MAWSEKRMREGWAASHFEDSAKYVDVGGIIEPDENRSYDGRDVDGHIAVLDALEGGGAARVSEPEIRCRTRHTCLTLRIFWGSKGSFPGAGARGTRETMRQGGQAKKEGREAPLFGSLCAIASMTGPGPFPNLFLIFSNTTRLRYAKTTATRRLQNKRPVHAALEKNSFFASPTGGLPRWLRSNRLISNSCHKLNSPQPSA